MIELTLCCPPRHPFPVTISEETFGSEFKTRLTLILPETRGTLIEEMRLVCGGKVIQDNMTLSSQGVTNKSKMYVSIKKPSSTSTTSSGSHKTNESDPLMGQLLKFLSDNPELYQQMIMSNPQMQKLIEKNPELGHALSDPTTLKSMLNAAANPLAYNEMLRGHDRAMSNLENIPEGFSHLKRIYSTLQEPMYDALTPPVLTSKSKSKSGSDESIAKRTTTIEPFPNPWAPIIKPTMTTRTKTTSPPANKRKLLSIEEEENNLNFDESKFLTGSMETMRLLSPLPRDDLREQFRSELEVMHKLGYNRDEDENIPALLSTNGHVSSAIDRILRKRSDPDSNSNSN